MGSSRLPGKVMADIYGQPVIGRLIDRLRRCHYLDDIVVATSTFKADDILAEWCQQLEIPCFRGRG